jgi:hypothetical protein
VFAPNVLPIYARYWMHGGGCSSPSKPYHGSLWSLPLSVLNRRDVHLAPLSHGVRIKSWGRVTRTWLLSERGFAFAVFSQVDRISLLWKGVVVIAQKPV